jgi:hypothetical protein
MAETPPAVLAYVNPQDNPPPYSFISVEQLSDRLVVVAPGVGALRYGADLLLHVLFMYLFLSAAVFIVLEFVKVDRPPWAYLLVPVALLALVIHSFARLMRVAVRPTRFELHEGMLKITRPLSAPGNGRSIWWRTSPRKPPASRLASGRSGRFDCTWLIRCR